MKLPCLIATTCLALGGFTAGRAADAIQPIDYSQRDTIFAPAATITPGTKTPQVDSAVQDKRVETATFDKKSSPLSDRRAAIDVQEAREKNIREIDSHRPELREQTMSTLNHRESSIVTGGDSKKPELVSKYQDSLTSASTSNMARFPATDRATAGKINRFVFRKNAPDSATALGGAAVTPAAGGSAVQK